jgi:hypothetical protein
MNDTQEYKLRWRGREAGPYALEEINRQLDEHEIGLGHEIFFDGEWITVEEFLNVLANPPAPELEPPSIPVPSAPPPAPQNTSPVRISISLRSLPSAPGSSARIIFTPGNG